MTIFNMSNWPRALPINCCHISIVPFPYISHHTCTLIHPQSKSDNTTAVPVYCINLNNIININRDIIHYVYCTGGDTTYQWNASFIQLNFDFEDIFHLYWLFFFYFINIEFNWKKSFLSFGKECVATYVCLMPSQCYLTVVAILIHDYQMIASDHFQ